MNIKDDLHHRHINLLDNVPSHPSYQYKLLTKAYIDQVVHVFTTAFCRSEPMTHYLKMDEEQYKIFARAVTEKACEDQLSIIALENDKVIACALVEDIANPGPIPDFDPKFEFILGLLEELGKAFFEKKSFPRNHIAHLFITAVDEDHRHLGLSKQVNFRAMDLASEKGFEFIYCELTHIYNELGIMHHLQNPKKLIGTRLYRDFIYKGSKPFLGLPGGAHSYLWAIASNPKLTYSRGEEIVSETFRRDEI
ncbi:MAG: hypothetical protein H0W64_09050 [Gammaproteobacteria bacterium]|nr:hypothetical protein [Gammaproteobacteria bacterium]